MRISDWSSDVCSSDLLYAGRAEERDHRWAHAGFVRTDDRLRGHQDPALRLREVPAGRFAPDHADEVRGRGDGDWSQLSGIAAEGAARSAERRVGQEGVSTCRSQWSTYT